MTLPHKKYEATVSAYTHRTVVCESCGVDYVYALKCDGVGSSTSALFLDNKGAEQRAEQEAANNLQRQLNSAIDAVPCPNCGWYQEAMVAHVRKEWGVWWIVGGFVGFVIGGLLLFYSAGAGFLIWKNGPNPGGATIPQTVTMAKWGAAIVGTSAALLLVRWRLAALVEPNDAPVQQRILLGKSRAALAADCTPERLNELYRVAAVESGR